jgi:hypothetical protein
MGQGVMSRQDDVKKLLRNHHLRLQLLKEREALRGLDTPPDILIEIQETEAKIEVLQTELQTLQRSSHPPPQPEPPTRPDTVSNSFAAAPPTRLFISYKRQAHPDQQLAIYLQETLQAQGHEVFIDLTMRTGEAWMEEIDRQLKASDFLIVLLSEASADSEMVKAEVSRAYEYRKLQNKPQTLPVRLAYEGQLPYSIAAFLNPLQYVVWQSEADNEPIARQILAAMAGQLPQSSAISNKPSIQSDTIAEDGQLIANDNDLQRPLPAFDPRPVKELVVPGGAVKLRDKLYVRRDADALLEEQIVKWGTTTTIRAPRQTGKTSLLIRGIHHARQQGHQDIFIDFQEFGDDDLTSLEVFLYKLAEFICVELDLDDAALEDVWRKSQSAPLKMRRFMENHVLSAVDEPLILAIDEADYLLQTDFYKDFFGVLRSWHNRRANREIWEKLNIVLIISTEPYLLIDDIHQSPFNVGLELNLSDFDTSQVHELTHKHGLPIAENDLLYLMDLLNGHPFLTRRALYLLATERLNWSQLIRTATADNGPFGDHLRHQYWIIRDKPNLKEALIEIIQTGHCSDDIMLFRLLRAGLVKGSGTVHTCRCGLYHDYFKDKLL